jgi:hypothetical protein
MCRYSTPVMGNGVPSWISGSSVSERTCSTARENEMASPTTIRTPYDQRVELVRDIITAHSKLGDKAASELAVHVLHALNSIPEKMR